MPPYAARGFVLRSPLSSGACVSGPLNMYGFGTNRSWPPALMGTRRQLASAGFLPGDPGAGVRSGGVGAGEAVLSPSTCYYTFEPAAYFGRPGFVPRPPRSVVITYPLLVSQSFADTTYEFVAAKAFAAGIVSAYPSLAARGIHVYLSSTGMTLGLSGFPTQASPFLSSPFLAACLVASSSPAVADLGGGFEWNANFATTVPAEVVGGEVLYVNVGNFGDYIINAPSSVLVVPSGVTFLIEVDVGSGFASYCSWDAKIVADSDQAAAVVGRYARLGFTFLYYAAPGDPVPPTLYGAIRSRASPALNVNLIRATALDDPAAAGAAAATSIVAAATAFFG